MDEICQRVPDWLGMPVGWALSIVVPIFKENSDIGNCICYGVRRILEHGMKVVKRVLEEKHCRIVTVDAIHFGFLLERETIEAVFIMGTWQEVYYAKENKLYVLLWT